MSQSEIQAVLPEIHKPFLSCVADRTLAQVAQKGCEFCSLEISKSCPDTGLCSLLWMSLLENGLKQMDPVGYLYEVDMFWVCHYLHLLHKFQFCRLYPMQCYLKKTTVLRWVLYSAFRVIASPVLLIRTITCESPGCIYYYLACI